MSIPSQTNDDQATPRTLNGRVAFVTGGARGIGPFIAIRLAQAGAAVAIGCRSGVEAARGVAGEIQAAGGRAMVVAGDLGDPAQVQSMVGKIEKELGPVTVLVHNAAPPRKVEALLDASWEEYDQHFRVAVQAGLGLARACVPAMRAGGFGRIVFLGTTSTKLYVRGFGAYCTAKGAMETFVHYLACELAGDGITVNIVAPGMTHREKTPAPADARFPLGRFSHARDVAQTIATLADPASAHLTGLNIPIDAGLRLLEPIRGQPMKS